MKRRLQLYPRGWGLLLPSLAPPPRRCPLGHLYREVAAAASLALFRMSFPLIPWATFFSGCLGNQPLLLEGEEGPKSDQKKKKVTFICWQIFEDVLKTCTPLPLLERKSLGISLLAPSRAASISRGREYLPPPSPNHQDWPCCNTHVPTQSWTGRERKDREINKPDRAPTHSLFVRKLKICFSDVGGHAVTRQLANGRDWNDGIDQII